MDEALLLNELTTMKFVNKGDNWGYNITVYDDVVEFEYFEGEDEEVKHTFDIPTFVGAQMLGRVEEECKRVIEEDG